LVPAILKLPDLQIVSAVSRSNAGRKLSDVFSGCENSAPIFDSVKEALATSGARPDILVDYTHPQSVKGHVLASLSAGVRVVVGTSGLTDTDYDEIRRVAEETNLGVLARGNFALTAVLLSRFALEAAKFIESWEIIDYAKVTKPDSPSGTARELASRLSQVRAPKLEVPIDQTAGPVESRGASIGATQVHSVRLPSYVLAVDAIFGAPGERLVIHHEAGTSAEPYVGGTVLAIRKVMGIRGLVRGLDSVL
jgi:4-hydroxy-tetrahydrodipicolinate reductase